MADYVCFVLLINFAGQLLPLQNIEKDVFCALTMSSGLFIPAKTYFASELFLWARF